VIVAERLCKRFGNREAVIDVSFEIGPGEVFALLGPNGSGKSTVLRMIVGVLRPDSGAARVAGFDIVRAGSEARARIGYVPEDIPLYDAFRVDEFLRMMAALKGVSDDAVDVAVSKARTRLDLDDQARTPIGNLSRGYRQRVAIAQAIIGSPPVLVLDEPTNGLDPRQIIDCRHLIGELAGEHAIVITSHILGEIDKVADRAAIMLGGRLLAVEALNARDNDAFDLEQRFLELTDHNDAQV